MRVRWTLPALNDLDDIQDYIARDSPAAAYRLAQDIAGRTEALALSPRLGRIGRARGTRELVFADYPYIVVYRLTEAVEILAVVHTARRWPQERA